MIFTIYKFDSKTKSVLNAIECETVGDKTIIKENGKIVYNECTTDFCDILKDKNGEEGSITRLKKKSLNGGFTNTITNGMLRDFVLIARELVYGIEKNDSKIIMEEIENRLSDIDLAGKDWKYGIRFGHFNKTNNKQYSFSIEITPLAEMP